MAIPPDMLVKQQVNGYVKAAQTDDDSVTVTLTLGDGGFIVEAWKFVGDDADRLFAGIYQPHEHRKALRRFFDVADDHGAKVAA